MILAAGLGTRLGEVTRTLPKALVPVGGVPMIEHVARRLIDAGAHRLVINTHHFPDLILEAVRERADFGVEVAFSDEPDGPLETGGGLLRAARFLEGKQPFFIHNVDVLSDIPLGAMYARHLLRGPIATLAVMERATSRYLLFDDGGLFGRVDEGKGIRTQVREAIGAERRLAFSGVHVASPDLPEHIRESGAFSILDPYLRLASEGMKIEPFDVDGHMWIDVGKPEQLAEAEAMLRAG